MAVTNVCSCQGRTRIPHWSPDGSQVSITAVNAAGLVVPAIVAADGSGYRELAVDPTLNLGCAGWSPDEVWLLCEAWDDADATRAGIYLVRAADGTGLKRLTTVRDIPGGYSPDGSQDRLPPGRARGCGGW